MSEGQSNELQTLVKMTNQIAANFSFHDDAVDKTVDHLKRFWAPSMKQQLIDHARAGGAGLDTLALQAAMRLST
jgi:formate dehydrogenase subunit delta